jgi:hypothetical protein
MLGVFPELSLALVRSVDTDGSYTTTSEELNELIDLALEARI